MESRAQMAEDGIRQPGRVTIRDVAADAGVSVAAVSKVLRNAYGVSEALRQKVEVSIDKLGYRPNMAARGLRGRTGTIGLLLLDVTNPFLAQVVEGVNDAIDPAGYRMMIGVSRANAHIEQSIIETMIDFRMDGLILVAPRLSVETLENLARQLPVVVVGQHVPDAAIFDTVNSDDRAGARQAVAAMVAAGFSDIGMISIANSDEIKENVSDLREQGYAEAMDAVGLGDRKRIAMMPDDPLKSAAQVRAWLAAPDRPRAVFCWSDLHGVLLANTAYEMGIRLPEDLAVVAYDNTPAAAMPLVGLSSVDQGGHDIGARAAQALFSRIAGRDRAEHVLLPTTLVRRRSL